MAFDWKTYIDLAQFLQQEAAGKTDREALLRSGVSRAYYGAFCHVATTRRPGSGFNQRAKRRIMVRCAPASALVKRRVSRIGLIACANGEMTATT
jgi:hypothetical protein